MPAEGISVCAPSSSGPEDDVVLPTPLLERPFPDRGGEDRSVQPRRLIIFANGLLPDPEAARGLLQAGDRIICADAGARHARLLGVIPHLVVGDLDSLGLQEREWLDANRIPVIQYPRDKDQTDLELALQHALLEDPEQILIVAALGARLDHTLGNIALLADDRLAARRCSLDDGIEQVLLCRQRAEIRGSPGDLVSLLPWGNKVNGVLTAGLKWPLHGEALLPESSRGISNEMTAGLAEIRIESGLLLILHHRLKPEGQAAPEV
jgi:thiamine pyrophosphokinase